jgi:Zn-dependent protease with chaperone function
VQRSATVNAYAAGGRSVAVTKGALHEFLARRLSDDHMHAVLLHEIGHLETGAARFSLVAL